MEEKQSKQQKISCISQCKEQKKKLLQPANAEERQFSYCLRKIYRNCLAVGENMHGSKKEISSKHGKARS